jgi:catechol 2,3-dioxygenase-like lactoylglutathione lyase family enzyme
VQQLVEGNKNPTFHSAVLLVKNIEKSKYFYNVVLGQKIIMDFGRNVGFEGGLAIWERDYALNLIFQDKTRDIEVGANNAEIYFESEDLDNLYKRLSEEKIKIIHPIREQPWGQRVFRLYDPDDHIIEFAESMESVVLRLNRQGLSLEEIAKKSMMPLPFIQMALQKQQAP